MNFLRSKVAVKSPNLFGVTKVESVLNKKVDFF